MLTHSELLRVPVRGIISHRGYTTPGGDGMFIDIHVHTRTIPGPPRGGKPAYATPEQLIARYDALGIESAAVLPGTNPECTYVPQSNEEVIGLAERYPGRFIPFCNREIPQTALPGAFSAVLGGDRGAGEAGGPLGLSALSCEGRRSGAKIDAAVPQSPGGSLRRKRLQCPGAGPGLCGAVLERKSVLDHG